MTDKSSHEVEYIQYTETPQIQLSHHNHFLEMTARRERLMVWKSCVGGDVFFTILPPLAHFLSSPVLSNSWKVWDTLLELIRVEWGKRWGETAEITFLLSLPVFGALFHWASVHMFSDRGGGGKKRWRGVMLVGVQLIGAVIEVWLFHSQVRRVMK